MAFPASQALIVLGLDHHHHKQNQHHEQTDLDIDNHHNDTPIRFLPLRHVYSATSPCVTASGSSNIISKKVKARKLVMVDEDPQPPSPTQMIEKVPLPLPLRLPPVTRVYCRRRFRRNPDEKTPFLGSLVEKVEPEELGNQVGSIVVKDEPVDEGLENEFSGSGSLVPAKKKRRVGSSELEKLGVDSSVGSRLERRRLRESRNHCNANKSNSEIVKKVRRSDSSATRENQECLRVRKWVPLEFDGVDPMVFIGFQCKVYWPLDDAWYQGSVIAYNAESNQHNVKYDDGDEETLILSQEKIKFCVSHKDMQRLNLKVSHKCMVNDDLDYGELLVLAATLDDCRELEPGDIIWAKLTGHSMWPAVIMDESRVGDRKGLGKCSGGRSVPVQFFGSHDFARIQLKQIVSFLRGLLSSFHLKCKSPNFLRGLREAKNYLNEQKLPNSMLHLQHKSEGDDHGSEDCEDDLSIDSDEAYMGDDDIKRTDEGFRTSPLKPGDLRIVSLGKIVKDSDNFCEGRTVWPLGYTAVRKFASIRDPSSYVFYKMEVLRDPESKSRPLFKITVDGEQFRGATPSACWNKIYKRIKKMQSCDAGARCVDEMLYPSGSEMFGFTNSEVVRRIQGLTNSKPSPKSSGQKVFPERYQNMPVGYRPVRIDWKDLDRCNVCHMDEEYENNLFLQCDKCRMMVHARCYGEECVDGVIWLCNLCRSEAPVSTPPCCLCPVIGGAMKPTTDGRWAHLACAIWIPETCLSDIKKMEPIDGLNRINKDRWKLLCSICGVPYGACIQCSNYNCRVAYHPLCARAAGLCVELEDEDKLHLISVDDDEEEQCIRLLSFCKKHKQPSNDRPLPEEWLGQNASQDSSYDPPPNQSGCARCEPYDYFGRRGRKEPEVLAAASVKRLFVENQPYLVGGYCLHDSLVNMSSVDNAITGSKFSFSLQKQITMNLDASPNILSMAEKYKYMRETFRKRLAFGKSRIHGFGIFAKQPHKAGDMMIEYTGELVRPSVADRREHFIYNSLVGAGTYMFRVDDERVIDATRAGSIAHLINHSCEPNCYSRVITVNGDEHIIIFAKRDIKQWEELTYDYRFFSIDEQLACYCGFPRCRGVVNDVESEEQVAKLYVPRSELIEWRGE